MKIFAFGSSIVSSYWNGAATYYRGCYKYLARRGHKITFAEPDAFGRQQHRDNGDFSYVESVVYAPTTDIEAMIERASDADIVIKHSGLGVNDALLERRVASMNVEVPAFFWDVDSPATLDRISKDSRDPFHRLIPEYDSILSYGGGPACRDSYLAFGARAYHNVYNGLDPETHYPVEPDPKLQCDVLFLGNRLPDREARVEELFLRAAELAPESSFLLGGEGWADKQLPANVRWIGHVPTGDHNRANCSAAMVMNINRSSMAASGYSPPTRVFEVAGAGACMLCDDWPGVDDCFEPSKEILVVRDAGDVVAALRLYDQAGRRKIGTAFRERALHEHTYAQRAVQAEKVFLDAIARRAYPKTCMTEHLDVMAEHI